MPLFNGNYVKRCPRGYRKDKKTDQCVLIRKPTNFGVNTGIWNLSKPIEPIIPTPDPPPDPDPPIPPIIPVIPDIPDIPIIPIIPPYVPPDDDTDDDTEPDKKDDNDITRILAESGGSLLAFAVAIGIGRNGGLPYNENGISNVMNSARRMLTQLGEETAYYPLEVTQSIEMVTRLENTLVNNIQTRTGTTLRNRARNVFPQSNQEINIEMVTTNTRGNIVTQDRTILDDDDSELINQLQDFLDKDDPLSAEDLLKEDDLFIEDFESFLSESKLTDRLLGDMTEAASLDINSDLIDDLASRQLLQDTSPQSFLSQAAQMSKKAGFNVQVRWLKTVKKLPENVYNNLSQAGASDEQIVNFTNSIDIDFNVNNKAYNEAFERQAYKIFKYDSINGTINLPAKYKGANAVNEFKAAEIQRTGIIKAEDEFIIDIKPDDFGGSSAIEYEPVTPLVPDRVSFIETTRYTEIDADEIIDYFVTENQKFVIKKTSSGTEKISFKEFEEQTAETDWFEVVTTKEGIGLGGNQESLKELQKEYQETLADLVDEINEFQANSAKRKLTPEDINTWAEERGTFEDELVNDLLERKTTFNQTIESATESIQTSIDTAIDLVTNTFDKSIDFITGETTPIYNVIGDIDEGIDIGTAITSSTGAAAGTASGIFRWLQVGKDAGTAAAAGEEGSAAAYAIGAAAATEIAVTVATGAVVAGVFEVGDLTYQLIESEIANANRKPPPIPPIDQFMSAIGITPTSITTDNPLGYAAFYYGGTSPENLYFFDQMPQVLRMAIRDNKSFQRIIVESLQDRYKKSDLYDKNYPFVMDYLKEERPIVTRQFTTDLRKSISGETPLNFLLKFVTPTTNNYIENILTTQPKFAPYLPLILEKKEQIQLRLQKRFTKQHNKYISHQQKLAEIKSNKTDRTRLKEITTAIADNRYNNGIFVAKHSGDLHRINEGIHYLSTHEYGTHGFKYIYSDATKNVLESYNQQQIKLAEQKTAEQNAHLADYEKLIVGQTQEEHQQEVIEQQQITDPNLSARENAILGGASGAAAASTQPRGYEPPQPNESTPIQNTYSMDG